MKKAIIYLAIIILSTIIGFIISDMKPNRCIQLITVDTEYSFLMEENQTGNILFYTNDHDHDVTDMSQYARIILSDHENYSKIELSLFDVEVGHDEVYLGEIFHRVILTFMLPSLSADWIFEDAHLSIELMNQSEYELRLGRVSLFQKSYDEQKLTWHSIEGHKAMNQTISRLGEITVELDGDHFLIQDVLIGTFENISFRVEHDVLKITINHANYLLYETPIILVFSDGSRQTISHFRFMIDYVILKESGPLMNVYPLN